MAQIKLQDLTAIIHGTSRYGTGYDIAHVETLLITDTPLPIDQSWYVPAGVSVPPVVLEMFKATNLPMYPMHENTILQGTQDILPQAQQGNLSEVINDAARFMLRAIMKKSVLTPLPNAQNAYLLSYDYNIYPLKDVPNAFEFKVVLPFDGLTIFPSGGKVQVTVITPINSKIDPVNTRGKTTNNQEIAELIKPVENTGHQIVSFEYHLDPEFTIRYSY